MVARHAAAGQLQAMAESYKYVGPVARERPEDVADGAPAVERARGLVLGLLLGDALAHGAALDGTLLTGGPASQLACFGLEGLIRAHVRGADRGVVDVPGMVWAAYVRWGHGQGLPVERQPLSGLPWPDGWVSQQAPLRERRGNAPATVAALTRLGRGTAERPTTSSAGYHAVTSTAPAALFGPDVRSLAPELAALTHGDPGAQHVAGQAVALLAEALHRVRDVPSLPASALLQVDGPGGTAQHAVRQGVAAVLAHPLPEQFLDALAAAHRVGGRGAAAYAGALLGACHGIDGLPADLVARLELGLIGDTLARDAVVEQRDVPAGDAYSSNPDRTWWLRYPGC